MVNRTLFYKEFGKANISCVNWILFIILLFSDACYLEFRVKGVKVDKGTSNSYKYATRWFRNYVDELLSPYRPK